MAITTDSDTTAPDPNASCHDSAFVTFSLEDEDKALAHSFSEWKVQQEGNECGFKFPMMDFVCDWLCKCRIKLSTGQKYFNIRA